MSEEDNINGAVLLDATIGSILQESHDGIRIGAPPMPKVAPTIPAKSPENIYLLTYYLLIGI